MSTLSEVRYRGALRTKVRVAVLAAASIVFGAELWCMRAELVMLAEGVAEYGLYRTDGRFLRGVAVFALGFWLGVGALAWSSGCAVTCDSRFWHLLLLLVGAGLTLASYAGFHVCLHCYGGKMM